MNERANDKKIAVLQMHSCGDVSANLAQAEALLTQAANAGARLAVLPEAFAYLDFPETKQLAVAEKDGDGRIQTFLAEQARRCGLWVIGGTVPIQSANNRLRSMCLLFDAEGKRVAGYQKIHLFNVYVAETGETYGESGVFDPGNAVVVADSPLGRIGFSVCYDLRFPELFRLLASEGAELMVVPSAFTASTGLAHWRTLTRARAIENTVYVAAANQGNRRHGPRDCYGHSMIVSPWGEVLAELGGEAGVACAALDFQRQETIRREFPCLSHRTFRISSAVTTRVHNHESEQP